MKVKKISIANVEVDALPENVYFRISFFMVSQMISLPLQRETTTLH